MLFDPPRNNRLLRVHHVARMCGVAPRTIRYWAEAGVLPGHKHGPRIWFFYENDVLTFLGTHRIPSFN